MFQETPPFPDILFGSAFPETRYMGSKQRLLPFIYKNVRPLNFSSVLDAFSGTSVVSYMFKQMGVRVYSNDFLEFCTHIAKATIENNTTRLSDKDVRSLTKIGRNAPTFIRDTFHGLYFGMEDYEFLDNLWVNISRLDSSLKRSIAFAAAARACIKKRPRGLFTFTGRKSWDGRRDLKLSLKDHFVKAVEQFNNTVFSNRQKNRAFNLNAFDLDPSCADLVYIDTPYVSPYSDCDYTRRYHFVEGFSKYWKDVEIMSDTKTRKIKSYETPFSTKANASNAFLNLFGHFKKSILVVSYSSNSVPGKAEMIKLLKSVKRHVSVYEMRHRYHHGNHRHKVGDNNNSVIEYLFIAR